MILAKNKYIPTLNRMGFMSPALDEIQSAFVNYCKNKRSGNFLDIGCGFGVATLPVIKNGCHITACDLEGKHLEVLRRNVPEGKSSFLTLIQGHFPNEVNFPAEYFDGIYLSMDLHFIPPQN